MNTNRVLCKGWLGSGCTYQNCTFAHGSTKLNDSVPLCMFGEECRNGDRCFRRHLSEWTQVVQKDSKVDEKCEVKGDVRSDVKSEMKSDVRSDMRSDVRYELDISNKKTKLCDNWKRGCCSHFDKMTCSFAHGASDLNTCVPICPQYNKNGKCDKDELCEFSHKYNPNWKHEYFCLDTMTLHQKRVLFAYLKESIEMEDIDEDIPITINTVEDQFENMKI